MTKQNKGASAPSVFNFKDQHTLRVIQDSEGELWFVASDVCAALEIGNVTMALRRLDEDEQALSSIEGISKGNDQANIINESGLYSLVLGSRKQEAKIFKKWVTSEVLPTIRKTGRYQMPDSPTISPAQQRALQDAIAARFPDGRQRPYAWSRFNNHFKLGSYKQLPADQCDAALAYIAAMDGGNPPATEAEASVQQQLQTARFVLSFDANGRMQLQEIAADAIVTTSADMAKLIEQPGGPIRRNQITDIIQAAAKRLK